MSIVVEVHPSQSESRVFRGDGLDSRSGGQIGEVIAFVPEEGIRFATQIADEQVDVAVVIHVHGSDAHSCLLLAVVVDRASGFEPDVAKARIPGVVPEGVRHAVVGDEDVGPTILVVVRDRYAKGGSCDGADAGLSRDVLESAISEIQVQPVDGRRRIVGRGAVVFTP